MSREIRILNLKGSEREDIDISEFFRARGVRARIVEVSSKDDLEGRINDYGPDVVLTELEGRDFDCFQVLEIMGRDHPGIPVIVSTGRGSEEAAAAAIRNGALGYVIKKPGYLEELFETITRAQDEAGGRDLMDSPGEIVLNKLIRNSVDILVVIDENGEEKFVSDSVERVTGFTPEDVIGSNGLAHIHPDDVEPARRKLAELIENPGSTMIGDYRHSTKDGGWVHLEAVGTNFLDDPDIGGIVLNIRDITARKQAEDSLRRSRDHLDKLVHNSSDILVILDEAGKELYVSNSVEEITGFLPEDLIGSISYDHIHPEDLELVREQLDLLLQYPDETRRVEFRRRKKDGSWVYLEAIGMNLLKDPDIGGLVINARDISERKKREEALRRNEEMLDKLIRNSSDLVVILDADGTEKYMSQSLEVLTGFSPEEVLGTRCFDHFHPDDLPAVKEMQEKLLKYPDCLHRVDYRRKKKDGGWIHLEAICSNLLEDPDIKGIVVNARDITERKKAEQKLSESRERYRLLASLLPEAVWEADLDGQLTFLNQKGKEILGYTDEDIRAGLNGFELFAMPGREACIAKTMAVLHGAETEITEYEMQRKDGTVFPALVHSDLIRIEGKPTCFIGIGIDITEHRKSEQEQRQLAAAIAQSGETILITDREGLIVYVNPHFEKVTGYSREEVLGKNPRVLSSGEQGREFYREMWEVLLSGRTWQGRFVNRRKDGSSYFEEATISPVMGPAGEICNFVAVKRDVTEDLRIAREKEELEKQFQQAQKMESVGLLAGGVAHDLNNLLTPILGYGEMLASGSPAPETGRDYAKGILEAGKGARDIVNQLLAFSRKQALEMKPVDLNRMVKSFGKLLRRMIPEDITIHINTCEEMPIVMADVNQLQQVVMNLAVNAGDAMPGGGNLTIETSVETRRQTNGGEQDRKKMGRHAVITMTDTGLGMDEKTKSQIFEPFFSTKPKQKGSGLGLATAYGIVRQHGGDIGVESSPLQGASFRVSLPVAEDHASPREAPEEENGLAKGAEKILLVEDDFHVREMTIHFLERRGYQILSAENGEDALELFGDSEGDIELLLTDVVMPGMNGKELYDLLLQYQPGLKVIYMSGYAGEVLKMRGVMDGDINFIQKPFSVQSLVAKIRQVLSEEDPAVKGKTSR